MDEMRSNRRVSRINALRDSKAEKNINGWAIHTQFKILNWIEEASDAGILNDVRLGTGGRLILTDDKETFLALVKAFDILHFDFTTGTPDEPGESYYIDFEFGGCQVWA